MSSFFPAWMSRGDRGGEQDQPWRGFQVRALGRKKSEVAGRRVHGPRSGELGEDGERVFGT